jgi:hypothetical protein
LWQQGASHDFERNAIPIACRCHRDTSRMAALVSSADQRARVLELSDERHSLARVCDHAPHLPRGALEVSPPTSNNLIGDDPNHHAIPTRVVAV